MLIRFFYTLILALVAPLLLFGLYKSKPNKPKFGKRWKEHFGITPKLASNQRPIWIHAASVGEAVAATPLIRAIKARNPAQIVLVTTTTSTGAEQVAKLGSIVEHRYMPIDFPFAVQGFIRSVRPSQMLIIETELWPNTLATVHRAGIPITVVNARLSEKSRANYAKIQPLFNQIHPNLASVLCQSQADADRFIALGTSADKITITGSIKFDINISEDIVEQAKTLRRVLGQERNVWIAASTHKGEDEPILAAHRDLLKTDPNALLILVPRHPDRFDDVFALCQQQGFRTLRRTEKTEVSRDTQVYLGDTMGEMLVLLGAADVCFMAGSLIGKKVGGHNVLEPAALSVPTITGPSIYNFKDIVMSLLDEEAILQVKDTADIADTLENIFTTPTLRKKLARNALCYVQRNQGSLERAMNHIYR